jgi:4-amino-4-deoxychorismate lyase
MMRALVDGVSATAIAVADRGLNYGDGLFETILVADSEPVWWEQHLARLQRGCEALKIAMPSHELLLHESLELCRGTARGVLKIVVMRGSGGRGYAPLADAMPTRIVSLHPMPTVPAAQYRDGIAVRWCDLRLAIQPALAGLKHLNRLEQVLARSEWNDADIAEGLMCDADDRVVCATAANLFLVRAGELITAPLHRCGVAGVTREWLMRQCAVVERDIARAEVESADELFLTGSLRGILPVARLGERRWTPGPTTRRLQRILWNAIPALEPIE